MQRHDVHDYRLIRYFTSDASYSIQWPWKRDCSGWTIAAGTWRLYNFGSTSMQRHDVTSTFRRRCINVMCDSSAGTLALSRSLNTVRCLRGKIPDEPVIMHTQDSDVQKQGLSDADLFISCSVNITKTCLYNIDPLKPHFYIIKLGFTGVYIIFLISAQKHRLWVLVRTASPRRF